MRFTYAAIRQNMRFYERAKELMPVISQFERGEVTIHAMQTLKLGDFADFYNFKKSAESLGLELDRPISWRKLKPILVENTLSERFKTFLNNKTQKSFTKLISENGQAFDRIINGRWVRKPSRRSYGKRHHEKCSGLSIAFVALINFIISNEIDTYSVGLGDDFKSFKDQEVFYNRIKWYTPDYTGKSILENALDRIPQREVQLSTTLMKSFVNFIQQTELDFRKLNSDFLIEIISKKIKQLMEVPTGTSLKCIKSVEMSNYSELTEGQYYQCITSNIQSGFVRVCVLNDRGSSQYYDYSHFEDVSFLRNSILDDLGIT